jgi:glycerophosphoryl diester phosphodiesterase
MKHFAHRGYSKHCTENTLPSFKSAIGISDGIECDIWRTRDRVWVIHHNNYLDGIGFISDHTLTELRQLKASLCLLTELLELLRKSIPVFLELKGIVTKDMVEHLSEMLKKYPDVTYYVGGFCSRQVYYLAKHFNSDQIVLNISDGSATTLMDVPAGIISISQEQLHSDLHQLIGNRQIWVYTVNDQYNYLKCEHLGIKTIITDDPTLSFLPN